MTINHIAVIMDGNGRWATAHNVPKVEGHRRGASVAKEIIKHAAKIGVKHLTLYAFSFENWNRPKNEVVDILSILNFYLQNQIGELHGNNIKFRFVGDLGKLSSNLQDLIGKAEILTQNNDLMTLYLAFSYGGRDEIIRVCQKLIESKVQTVTAEDFARYLDTPYMPDVDLMIRSSGEKRISNFLIWQSAYSELYFSSKLWPDFTIDDLDEAIKDFYSRKRNFGYAREHHQKS
jgi:undecaprenyl diphosphate synthase